ncbi:hypothetical protein D7W81_02485 [Corallococcus aberystwythensis]|uniref:Adenosine deaminase domain-containing protein n=2 Tax=Corallococcus aberystwythensis TaxID=2316722 RepID=A0A3A8R2I8_9BACT|nr:hypothetical protein D7W81_02485 [Corallococcus aberystwythensis]
MDSGTLHPASSKLADDLSHHLKPLARGGSLEVLTQLREALWFEEVEWVSPRSSQCRVSLHSFLMRQAQARLEFSGPRVCLRISPGLSLAEAVHHWRWTSLSLPGDVLIAAHAAATGQEPPADSVSLGAPELDGFFSETELAQTHLHLGAAIPFERLWTHLMAGIASQDLLPGDLKGTAGFVDTREFLCWLVTAALARLSLGSFLFHLEQGQAQDLGSFLPGLAKRTRPPQVFLGAMSALSQGKDPVSFAEARRLLRTLQGQPPERLQGDPLEVLEQRDPLFEWLGLAPTLPETRLIARSFRYLRTSPADKGFASLFWQYLRIRNLTYRHLVLAPGTGGLDWFSTHFRNISPLRKGMDERTRVCSALEMDSRGARLASLEVRTSPSAHWGDIRNLAREVKAAPFRREEPVARALVLHFIKETHTSRPDKLPNADPRQRAHGCRFGSYFHAREQEVLAIETVLRRHPRLLQVLRGMDVCHLELAVPTWVFVPLLQRVRQASARVAESSGGGLRALGLTLHAGEEFRRLSEGLRHIHEPVEFQLLQRGDRLGHALALGTKPRAWCRDNAVVPQPKEEHLDDLLWELDRVAHDDWLTPRGRARYVKEQATRLGAEIYGGSTALVDLRQARKLRGDAYFLATVGYPFMRSHELAKQWGPPGELAVRYLSDFAVYTRGRQPELVTVHPTDAAMLERTQQFLRSTLAALEITIEANPTSNMLIGEVALEHHPIFSLQPLPGKARKGVSSIAVALGSDDPVTLATSLPDEFAYLYFELLRAGVSRQEAQSWLRRVAEGGMRARFTHQPTGPGPRAP